MKSPLKAVSTGSFVWTILLIIILAAFVFVTLLTNVKSRTIRDNIQAMHLEDENYLKIDSCISLLYMAENNNRMYVITLDSVYSKRYSEQLGEVTRILSEFESERTIYPVHISRLISKKQLKNEEFINLKMNLDSLLSFSAEKLLTEEQQAAVRIPVRSKIKRIATTDSVLVFSKKSKRKLFKRVLDAIANKESQADSLSRTTIRQDSVISPLRLESIQDASVLEQFNRRRRELNEAEQQLLNINARIFANLQDALKGLKQEEEEIKKELRKSLLISTSAKFDEVSRLSWGSVVIVIALTFMIIRNLVKLYKNERMIIRYASMSAEITKQKGEFVTQMAHEIRTPLNSIIGFSQLIDTQKLADDLRVNIDSIKTSSGMLLSLVNEMLDFSKFESGNIKLVDREFFPVELLNEQVVMLSVLAAQKNVSVTTTFGTGYNPALIGDDFRIKQVVVNLITNAIKFTPQGGNVIVSSVFEKTSEDHGLLKINVKDSGVGIAKENLNRIFDDFIQVEMVDSASRHMGTGLGLAICKKIVDLFGGKIAVESTLGSGSEFHVILPLSIARNAAVRKEIAAKPALLPNLEGRRILIADDTRINLLLMSKIMEKNGLTYDLASDGKKALGLFESNPYDLVITDIHMPEMDGFELTRMIRKHDDLKKSKVPVLGFTGSSTDENKLLYTSIGMNEILEKPFEEKDLIGILNRLLN